MDVTRKKRMRRFKLCIHKEPVAMNRPNYDFIDYYTEACDLNTARAIEKRLQNDDGREAALMTSLSESLTRVSREIEVHRSDLKNRRSRIFKPILASCECLDFVVRSPVAVLAMCCLVVSLTVFVAHQRTEIAALADEKDELQENVTSLTKSKFSIIITAQLGSDSDRQLGGLVAKIGESVKPTGTIRLLESKLDLSGVHEALLPSIEACKTISDISENSKDITSSLRSAIKNAKQRGAQSLILDTGCDDHLCSEILSNLAIPEKEHSSN
jgi:hypothetical protein